ncbi:MAG: dihydrofolate reductase family protein [Alphaproteobacteria bacterium]
MPTLSAFMNVSIDGCFCDAKGDMNAFHTLHRDPEFQAFTEENARGGGRLVFGRKTYDMMAGYWPSPMAKQQNPVVAEQMNAREKFVISHKMKTADWANTTVLNGDLGSEVKRLKAAPGPDMVILGSGSIVSQLAAAKLLDGLQLVVNPIIFGDGRKLMEGFDKILPWKLTRSCAFKNGAVFLDYAPA